MVAVELYKQTKEVRAMRGTVSSKATLEGYKPEFWKRAIKYFCIIGVIAIGLLSIIATNGGGSDTAGGGSVSGSGK